MTYAHENQPDLFMDIVFSQLYFMGPENLMKVLQGDEIIGKYVTIEGYLYRSDNRFKGTGITWNHKED